MKKRIESMKSSPFLRASILRATLLTTAMGVGLVGCGDDSQNMSQEEIQYISHLDQARFFQRQGELKASTLEARSAIELQPGKIDPYFVIINNLITAGDAVNAERQLERLVESMPAEGLTEGFQNQVALIRAEANLMQGKYNGALSELDTLTNPDRAQELEAALLRGRIQLASGKLTAAEEAYTNARKVDESSVLPLVGQSRVAFARNNPDRVEELIAEAEQLDSQEPELWLWKAQYEQAQGNWQASEDAYIKALEDIGQYDIMTLRKYETISALIDVLRAQNKSSEAFVYEEILARSAPGTIKSNMVAAREAFTRGDLTTAARYLEEILAQSPSHEQSALMLGMVRFRQGRTEEAERLLAPLAELGDSPEANKLLAATKLEMRDPEAAKELLENLDDNQTDPDILALVGIASLASGDLEAGEGFVEKSLEINPDNHNLRLRYASYLIQKGETEKALELAQRAMDANPELDQARLLMIRVYMDSGDQQAAEESANAWVKEQPDNVAALLTRGQLALATGDLTEAKRYAQQAHETAPDDPSPLIALGNLAKNEGNSEAEKRYFSQAAKLAPDNRQALQSVSSVLSRDETIALMQEILETKPAATGPRLVLLESALIEGDDARADELSAELLERESANQPSPASPVVAAIYNGVSGKLIRDNDLERAETVLSRGRVLFPENEDIALQSAQLAFQQNAPEDAREILQEAKRVHPDSPRPFMVEASFLTSQGNHKQAAELYQLALNKQHSAQIALAYAGALQSAGQGEKAIEFLADTAPRYPDNANVQLTLAMLYQSSNDSGKADELYEKVLELEPDNVLALNNLAWMYHEHGDDRAMALAERAYRLNPESGAVADTYGWIMFKSGKHQDSITVLEKAHELQPDSEEIARHLAEAYRTMGMNSAARRILEKFTASGNG